MSQKLCDNLPFSMKKRTIVLTTLFLILVVFLGWRLVRPMNIFTVSEAFERPISTANIPPIFKTLSAEECATCHREFYDEWKTAIHSQAWTDPYFQADWRFDHKQQICKNCHTPLDRQQEHRVLGFHDAEKWDPVLEPNPGFDRALQHEGVTCSACHFRDGKILGPYGDSTAPHPVQKLDNPNRICVRCHVVSGDRWDTFFRFPPCGTVAEIRSSQNIHRCDNADPGVSGEVVVDDLAGINCVDCHMPLVERPIVEGGKIRLTRLHLWRGGHDPEMVKSGLDITFKEEPAALSDQHHVTLTITNIGAAHYIPTGTPDRHLTIELTLLDSEGNVIKKENHTLKRWVMWRPFIIDLRDTRLPYGQSRSYTMEFNMHDPDKVLMVGAVVRYHLLDEKRRKRISYENREPISYEVFREQLIVNESVVNDDV